MVRRRRTAHFLAPCALALAFGTAGCPGPETPEEEPPHLLYSEDVQSPDNPFPDLRLLTPDGMALRPGWYRPFVMKKALTSKLSTYLESYADAARELEGVGNFGETLLPVSARVDPASLEGIASRLVKAGDGYEVLEEDVIVETSAASLEGTGKEPGDDYPAFLVVRPTVILPEGEEGMLVIRRGLKTVDGTPFGRGFDFDADPANVERAQAAAQALGLAEEDVLLALPLHAAAVTAPLKALAQWTVDSPAPAFTIGPKGQVPAPGGGDRFDGVWKKGGPDWGTVLPHLTRWPWTNPASDVGQLIVGTFEARELREDGIWKAEWVADPDKAPVVDLLFVLTLPDIPKPAGGWEVVIGGHGLNGRNIPLVGGSSSFCLEVAQALAARGLGCLGIDATQHATRGNSLEFFAVDDLRKPRDNFRQMAFDQMQLSRLAEVLDVDGDQQPDLSKTLGYLGNSLGGIMGANFMSLDPRVDYGVLNVPGGGLATILTSEDIRDKVGLLLIFETGMAFGSVEYYQAFPLFRTVGQLFIEGGDPVNIGPAFRDRKGRAILIQEGKNDGTVPNVTTDNLARAMGVPDGTASVSGSKPLRVHTQIDPVKFGEPADFEGHNVLWYIEAARTQAFGFLGSHGTQLVVE